MRLVGAREGMLAEGDCWKVWGGWEWRMSCRMGPS